MSEEKIGMIKVKSYTDNNGWTWYEQPIDEISHENLEYLKEHSPLYAGMITAENAYKRAWNDILENRSVTVSEMDRLSKQMQDTHTTRWEDAKTKLRPIV